MDLGTTAAISRMLDRKNDFEKSRTRVTLRAFKNAHSIAVACIKGEYRRKSISEDEYSELMGICQKAQEGINAK